MLVLILVCAAAGAAVKVRAYPCPLSFIPRITKLQTPEPVEVRRFSGDGTPHNPLRINIAIDTL